MHRAWAASAVASLTASTGKVIIYRAIFSGKIKFVIQELAEVGKSLNVDILHILHLFSRSIASDHFTDTPIHFQSFLNFILAFLKLLNIHGNLFSFWFLLMLVLCFCSASSLQRIGYSFINNHGRGAWENERLH